MGDWVEIISGVLVHKDDIKRDGPDAVLASLLPEPFHQNLWEKYPDKFPHTVRSNVTTPQESKNEPS